MNDTRAERSIDGKAFAAGMEARIGAAVAALKTANDLVPGLHVIIVGDDPASQVYVRNKGRRAAACGMASQDHRLAATTSQAQLLALIARLNSDRAVNGVLVQLPLPPQIDPATVIDAIDPAKDVDGFHAINAGRLATGQLAEALIPSTPQGVMLLLEHRLGDLAGHKALVLGRSNIVGRPVAQLLVHASCTVTIAHSKTRDLPGECRQADILVAAVGRPEMVRGDWIKPGATVIDVGINRVPRGDEPGKHRLVGDVAFAEAMEHAGAITPVPGGMGPMTIACLLANTLTATCRQNGLTAPAIS